MKSIARPVLIAFVLLTVVSPSWALKVVTWDLMGYPKWDGPAREAGFRVVLNRLNPDVLVVQGMTETDGVARFLEKVMNANKPGAYRAAPVQIGEKLDVAVFWRPSLVAHGQGERQPEHHGQRASQGVPGGGQPGNPLGEPSDRRTDWITDPDITTFTEDAEVLYFSCCIPATFLTWSWVCTKFMCMASISTLQLFVCSFSSRFYFFV